MESDTNAVGEVTLQGVILIKSQLEHVTIAIEDQFTSMCSPECTIQKATVSASSSDDETRSERIRTLLLNNGGRAFAETETECQTRKAGRPVFKSVLVKRSVVEM